ncbi:uncharacterized protein LOC131941745 [Physella acuta]|uniref:uncharacterized protein LOC131941745 n=1 Tax=Physella acuta TaxID=109671 RepID=UPI0027DDE05A|nr:uncharacterized protein LOC131941745 [Physella acuta]
MENNVLFGVLLVAWSSVSCDTIVNPYVVADGGSFVLKCDASLAGVPANATSITATAILWKNWTTPKIYLAHYSVNHHPYKKKNPPPAFPERNWTFNFSGGFDRSEYFEKYNPKNRNTMKIEIVVKDAKCTDAGTYFCNVDYLDAKDDEVFVSMSQDLTIKVCKQSSTNTLLSTDVVEDGLSFTVTCDSSRAGIPANAATVKTMYIAWTNGTEMPINLARYDIRTNPYTFKMLPQNSSSWKRTFEFIGGFEGLLDRPNNRNTMKIKMTVYNSESSDTGLYICNGIYFNSRGEESQTQLYQYLSIKASSDAMFNPNVVPLEDSFLFKCDANIAGVPEDARTIKRLTFGMPPNRDTHFTLTVVISEYKIDSLPFIVNVPPTQYAINNWNFYNSGGFEGSAKNPNNRNTMQIKIVARGAKCADGDTYFCKAEYMGANNKELSVSKSQNLTIKDRVIFLSMGASNHYFNGHSENEPFFNSDSNAELYCQADGSQKLTFKWMFGRLGKFELCREPDFIRIDSFDLYPLTKCDRYWCTSKLKFRAKSVYDALEFQCVVTENNTDTVLGNIPIYVNGTTKNR